MTRAGHRQDISEGRSGRSSPSILGRYVRQIRASKGLRREDLLPEVGVRALARIENGEVATPSDRLLQAIARRLREPFSVLEAKRDAEGRHRIVLQRFTNMKGSEADSLDMLLRVRLRRIPSVLVLPPRTVDEVAPEEMVHIAEYELAGSAVRVGRERRLACSLLDTLTQLPVWSDEVPIGAGRDWAASNDLAAVIARALRIGASEHEELAQVLYWDGPATESLCAGWSEIYRPPLSLVSLARAAEAFQRVLDVDSDQPSALAGIAIVHLNRGLNRWTGDPEGEIARGTLLAQTAVAAAPGLSEAHFALGLARRGNKDLRGSKQALEIATRLDPSSVGAWIQLAIADLFLGHPKAALKQVRSAKLIRPGDPSLAFLLFVEGVAHLFVGDDEAAVDALARALALNPDLRATLLFLSVAQLRSGDNLAARDTLAEFVSSRPGVTVAMLASEQPSRELRYQPYIDKVYRDLLHLGLPAGG